MAVKKAMQSPESLIAFDAETNVLSAILMVPEVIDNLDLAPSMFGIERHQWIYAAMQRIHAQGSPITVEQVKYQLEASDRLERAGGLAYLAKIVEVAATSANARGDADLVYRMAIKRELANYATDVAALAYDSALLAPSQIVETARRRFDQLPVRENDSADPWESFKRTLAHAYEPRPPVEFVLDGIFVLPSLNVVYGAPGTLKSFLLADLAVCVAANLPWLTPLQQAGGGYQTKAAPVLWLDFDNGRNRTDERFESIGRARGVDAAIPLTYFSMPSPWLDASDFKSVDALIRRIEAANARLVVIDNLGLITGGADENSADMTSVMGNLRRVAETANAAVIVIHHQRKTNFTAARAGESLRGHSSIEAALDLALLVEREDRSELINLRSTKTRGVDVAPFGAHFTFEHKPESKELAAARFWGIEIEDLGSDRAIEAALIASVTGNAGISKGDLVKRVREGLPKASVHRVRSIIAALTQTNRLRMMEGAKGAQHFQLP